TIPKRGRHRLAERNADVLHRVMLIDIEVALCCQLQIEATMPREQFQHVIEEPDPRMHVVSTFAIENQPQGDLRLAGRTLDRRSSHSTSSSAARNCCVCSTTPAVMRRQSVQP